jgi:integration host factor subunit alpha
MRDSGQGDMTKDGIVTGICGKNGLSKNDAANLVEATFEIIKDSLERGEKVKIKNFGNFSVHTKDERRGRNPHTGAEILIPAHRVVTFTPSPAVKKTVNSSAAD